MNFESQPLVSICMPAFNVERTLRAALDSVLAQTYTNFEIVLVDDGSTDATQKIAESYSDERFRYIRNESNLGGYQTMNKAVGLAKGEFIAIYHTDDIYEPEIVEREVSYLLANPQSGAVFCMDHFMDAEGRIYGGASLPSEFEGRNTFEYEEVFRYLLRNKNTLFCCPTFMTRRKVLDDIGLFDAERFDIAADLDMWIRIVRRCPVGILGERLMRYRHAKSQWSSRYNYLRTDQELCFDILDHYIREDGWLERLKQDDLIEYDFHRCDDETFRAANWIIRGEADQALQLLNRSFPWKTLSRFRRRKLRVLLLRALIRGAVVMNGIRPLGRLLMRTEYGSAT